MPHNIYNCIKNNVGGTGFQLEMSLSAPDNALQVVGVFSDGHSTASEDHSLASSLAQHTFQAGDKFWIAPNVLAVGLKTPNTIQDWKMVGAHLMQAVPADRVGALMVDGLPAEKVIAIGHGAELSMWRFDRFHTSARPLPAQCKVATLVTPHATDENMIILRQHNHHLVDSMAWARDIANRPGNDMTPKRFMELVRDLQVLGVTIQVLDQKTMSEKGFGALLGVAQGSIHEPYLVTASWMKGDPKDPTIALVGKGVTFDSGGISIKPAHKMEEMKLDKTGAVVVAATVRALALQNAPVNVVAVLALVENMVSGSAQRPGDIVQSLSGQTIEVINTDAEGRLILADALTYAQHQFSPQLIIDVATLTGAVRGALGPVYAGLMGNDDALCRELIESGQKTGEELWRLPLHPEYDKAMNSACADMQNISSSGFGAGCSTAGQFLGRFIDKGRQWAHLDIAGVDMSNGSTPLSPRGGSAFGIQLLVHWILNYATSQDPQA